MVFAQCADNRQYEENFYTLIIAMILSVYVDFYVDAAIRPWDCYKTT